MRNTLVALALAASLTVSSVRADDNRDTAAATLAWVGLAQTHAMIVYAVTAFKAKAIGNDEGFLQMLGGSSQMLDSVGGSIDLVDRDGLSKELKELFVAEKAFADLCKKDVEALIAAVKSKKAGEIEKLEKATQSRNEEFLKSNGKFSAFAETLNKPAAGASPAAEASPAASPSAAPAATGGDKENEEE